MNGETTIKINIGAIIALHQQLKQDKTDVAATLKHLGHAPNTKDQAYQRTNWLEEAKRDERASTKAMVAEWVRLDEALREILISWGHFNVDTLPKILEGIK